VKAEKEEATTEKSKKPSLAEDTECTERDKKKGCIFPDGFREIVNPSGSLDGDSLISGISGAKKEHVSL
jgi:hypothetical protein